MVDIRERFYTDIKEGIGCLCDDVELLQKVMLVVSVTMEKYEIAERCTDVAVRDNSNIEMLKQYAACLKVDGKSIKTIFAYINELKKFDAAVGIPFVEITTNRIRGYLAEEMKRGISMHTAENKRSYISSFFQWMHLENYIPINPCAKIPPIKYYEKEKLDFSDVEIDTIRAKCKNVRERAIVEFLLSTGVRVEEFVNLTRSDVDIANKTVNVRHGKGDKQRYVYLSEIAAHWLIKYLSTRKDIRMPLFLSRGVKSYTTNGIRAMLCRISNRSGVANVHPHRFRRTLATKLAAKGMAIQMIQKILGHADISVTMDYIRTYNRDVQNEFEKYAVA